MDRREFLRQTTAVSLAGTVLGTTAHSQGTGSPSDSLTQNLNPTIQHARDVALKILKPTAKNLDRGLRLHAESMVFDTYGFSPRAALDGDALAQAVENGASAIEIKDLREEMSMTRYVTDPIERAEYLAAWKASGVTCVF